MGLESATFINDLVSSNPVVGDNVSQGDDHLRLVKAVLKASFPNLTFARYLEQPRVDLASATTPDLSTPASNYINITGTTQIDGFATEPEGMTRLLRFDGALTLNYNATSFILPSDDDILTVGSDHAIVISMGSGNWRILQYIRKSGKALIETDPIPTIAAGDVGKYLKASDDSPKTTVWDYPVPAGAVAAWPHGTPPTGWLECDGSAVSRTTYAQLFALIGTMYGAGNGTSTFNIPDYRGEFLRGMDPGATRDPDSASRTDRGDGTTGAAVGTKQGHQFASHTHDYDQPLITNSPTGSGASRVEASTPGTPTGATGGNETRPRNVNVKWIIKAH